MECNPYQSPTTVDSDEVVLAMPVIDVPRCCDQCGGVDFVTWAWWHPVLLHWMLNPGLAFNELVLGQRVPAHVQTCRQCLGDKWTTPATYLDCPTCRSFHRMDVWEQSAFGNWYGIVCPDCGGNIPCLRNLTALLGVIVLAPIWWPLSWLLMPYYRRWGQRRARQGRKRSMAKRPPVATPSLVTHNASAIR